LDIGEVWDDDHWISFGPRKSSSKAKKCSTFSIPQRASAKLIPLANPEALDDKEKEKEEKEDTTGEGEPQGEYQCH